MKYIIILFLLLLTGFLSGQMPFDYQRTNYDQEVPIELKKNFLRLIIYNSHENYLIQGIGNRLALKCADLTQNRIVLENSAIIERIEDSTPWYSSKHKVWIAGIDFNDGQLEPWVDSDTVKWKRTYIIKPEHSDSIELNAYYLNDSKDSIFIGNVKIAVKSNKDPFLVISDRTQFPYELPREKLLALDNLKAEFGYDHPEPKKYGEIVYFEFNCFRRKKQLCHYEWHNNYLNHEMRAMLQNCKKGTVVQFANIKTRESNLGSIQFRITN